MRIKISIEDEVRVAYSRLLKSPYPSWQAVSIHDAEIDELAKRLECKLVHRGNWVFKSWLLLEGCS